MDEKEKLIRDLKSGDVRVRKRASFGLMDFRDSETVSALIGALKDEDVDIRVNAAEALGIIKDKAAGPALIEALNDETLDVRSWAAASLHDIIKDNPEDDWSDAIPPLTERMEEKEFGWYYAAAALGIMDRELAVPSLIRVLKGDNESERGDAAKALREIGDESVIPELIRALKYEDRGTRSSVIHALGKFGERLVPALLASLEDEDVREGASRALGYINATAAVPALLRFLKGEACRRRCAAEALGGIGSGCLLWTFPQSQDYTEFCRAVVPALLEALQDDDEDVRFAVVIALGEIGHKSAAPALIYVMGDDEEEDHIRSGAAYWLGGIGDPSAIPFLIKALEVGGVVAADAVASLAKFDDIPDDAVPGLIGVLESDNSEAVEDAGRMLAGIGKPAVPGLIRLLGHDVLDVLTTASEALREIGDDAVPGLVTALGDEDFDIRTGAADTLMDIVNKAYMIEDVQKAEAVFKEASDDLAKKRSDQSIEARMGIAKVMKRISERKNELASRRDVLLDGKPKSPKKKRMYQAMRLNKNGNL